MTLEIDSWELGRIVQDAIKEKFPDRQHFRDEAILELMISQLTAYPDFLESMDASMAQRDEQAKKLAASDSLWRWVEEIIEFADIALTRYLTTGKLSNAGATNSHSSLIEKRMLITAHLWKPFATAPQSTEQPNGHEARLWSFGWCGK